MKICIFRPIAPWHHCRMVVAGLTLFGFAAGAAPSQDIVHNVMELIELVMDRHIDPPSRQEMVLSAVKAVCAAAELDQPFDLSERVSTLTDNTGLGSLMEEFVVQALAGSADADRLEQQMLRAALVAVSADAALVDEEELKVEQQLTANRYVGTGIVLGMRNGPLVQKTFRRGPGHQAGLRDGDSILRIDGQTTDKMDLKQVVELLRGREGDPVELTVRQPSQEARTVVVTRGEVPRETMVGYRELGDEEWAYDVSASVGYVKLTEIGASTVHELRQVSEKMRVKGLRALVIDLRSLRRPSNAVEPAVLLANALLDHGKIGRLRTRDSTRGFEATPDCLFRDWPQVVLFHRDTAVDAWIVAAALQENGRAVVMGHEPERQRMLTTSMLLPGTGKAVLLATGVFESPGHPGTHNPENLAFRRSTRPAPSRSGREPRRLADVPSEQTNRDRELDAAIQSLEESLEKGE